MAHLQGLQYLKISQELYFEKIRGKGVLFGLIPRGQSTAGVMFEGFPSLRAFEVEDRFGTIRLFRPGINPNDTIVRDFANMIHLKREVLTDRTWFL